MSSRRYINQFTEQEAIDQVFRVADKQLRANRQGGKYILLKLADRTGNMVAMLWNADEPLFESFQRGDYARCRGRTQTYNGALQMIVTQLDRVAAESIDPADFEAFDREASSRLLQRLRVLLGDLQNADLRALGEAYLADDAWVERLCQAPAAVSNHHAYPGGLLQHTVDLMELATVVGPRYPALDVELLMFGAFLHDLGKIEELSGGGELTYTDRGQFVGHLVIGVVWLAERITAVEARTGKAFPETLRWQLEHMIVSHHGQLEFGSPKVPMSLEALALHHLDNLDAKLACALAVMEVDLATESNWTNFNPALGRKLWKPAKTSARS